MSWSYDKSADGYRELTGPDSESGVDPAFGARSLAEVYEEAPGYTPPPTVSALVGTTTGQVVSDDSGDLLFDLSTAWWGLYRGGAPGLYPFDRRNSTDVWDAWIGSQINVDHTMATYPQDPERAAVVANGVLVGFDVTDTLLARTTWMEASREDGLTILDGPVLPAVVAIDQYLYDDKPTGSDIHLFTTVQSCECGEHQHYPGGEAPSISFWPAPIRWFRALENRSGWVGSEERSALGC